jgi:uncharacterized protein with FMN-binding domain
VTSTSVIGLFSIAGALGVNLWLNPASQSTSVGTNSAQPQTVTGDAVEYRYGVIQIEITATAGKLDKINLLQQQASPGWEQAFPILNEEALAASSSNIANVSGATFTTQAYQQALSSAISKLQ